MARTTPPLVNGLARVKSGTSNYFETFHQIFAHARPLPNACPMPAHFLWNFLWNGPGMGRAGHT